jgi:hypothetical protein
MKPQRAAALAAALLFVSLATLAAEDAPAGAGTPADNAPAADEVSTSPYLPGEQTIGIAAGAHIPAFIVPETGGGAANLSTGGSFSFSYQYFLLRGLAAGGTLSFAFNGTIGGQSIFTMPLGATVAYWWAKMPFEFSILGEAGGYLMRYHNTGMIDPFFKAGAGAYWRLSSGWSVGLQSYLWFVPEIHYGSYSNLSQYAGFVETSLAAVYHL